MEMSVSVGVDPTAYLVKCFKPQSVHNVIREFALKQVHHFFTHNCQFSFNTESDSTLKVLDYGCGPVLANTISAAGLSNIEIVLAEYSSDCCKAIMKWVNEDPSAWNWLPYIKHIVQDFEGKSEKEALAREKSLRKSIKAVVACDITQDPPIAEGFDEPYDIVMSMLCIENGCLTRDDYRAAVKRTSTLVKSGGTFLLYSSIRNREEHDQTPGYYHVGETKHLQVALPLHFVLMTLEENGFIVMETNMLPEKDSAAIYCRKESDLESTAFIIASKM